MVDMMKHTITALISASVLILLSSCVMIMESGEDGKSVFYVECLQGLSDTTAISVIATAPKFGYEKSRILSDVNVTLKAGGREIPLSNADVAVEMFPKGAFYTTEKIPGGQTLEITVSGAGFDPVRATTFKPHDLKPFDVRMSRTVLYDENLSEREEMKAIKMEITPDDPDIIDHFYAVVFDKRWQGSDGRIFYSHPNPILQSDGIIYTSTFGDDLVVKTASSPWSLFRFNDNHVSDRISPIYLWRGASLMRDGTITVFFLESDDPGEYRVHLMEVSPEFYRYSKSLAYEEEYTEALVPFFPSSYSYTNIVGGCGVFAAVSRFDGEWIELPE